MAFRVEENGEFRGVVVLRNAKLNDGCIENKHVAVSAGLAAAKLQHQHRPVVAQESGTTATDEIRVAHIVVGTAAKVLGFKCGCVVACTGTDVIDFDLLKNGVSILTGAVRVDNADAAYALLAGTLDDDVLAAGDVLEVKIDVTAGDGALGEGAFAYVDLEEDYS